MTVSACAYGVEGDSLGAEADSAWLWAVANVTFWVHWNALMFSESL